MGQVADEQGQGQVCGRETEGKQRETEATVGSIRSGSVRDAGSEMEMTLEEQHCDGMH